MATRENGEACFRFVALRYLAGAEGRALGTGGVAGTGTAGSGPSSSSSSLLRPRAALRRALNRAFVAVVAFA
jgi:hypothetical protein